MMVNEEMQRFYDKIFIEPNCGCWLWEGAYSNHGYGYFKYKRKVKRSHRLSYEFHYGEVPDGLVVDHLCKNKGCVNPRHLEAVSQKVNVKRGNHGGKTHCLHGHPLSGENLYVHSNGSRKCRKCKNAARSRYRRKGKP